MWNLFNCYLSGHHDYGMWCEPGTIFLRCIYCGKRSSGWSLDPKQAVPPQPHALKAEPPHTSTVLPFSRAAAR
jgi:hypothetical protein